MWGDHRAVAFGAVVALDGGARRARARGAQERADNGLPRLLAAGDDPLAREPPGLEREPAAVVGAPHPRLVRSKRGGCRRQGGTRGGVGGGEGGRGGRVRRG